MLSSRNTVVWRNRALGQSSRSCQLQASFFLSPTSSFSRHPQVIQESTLSTNLSNRGACKCFSMCVHHVNILACVCTCIVYFSLQQSVIYISRGRGYCQYTLCKFKSDNLIQRGQTLTGFSGVQIFFTVVP